jgi:APA family basic amino acid/polyamine antiporter
MGWPSLLVLGVATILGAGVYVMTGTAAALYAGPAVTVSFVLAAFACLLVALCYAELASCIPDSGSAYTYCRYTLGRVAGWSLGWLLFLEYSIAASLVAVGFSGYLGSLLLDFGIHVPQGISASLVQATVGDAGVQFTVGGTVNLVAATSALAAGVVLSLGVSRSSVVNALLVVTKVLVLLGFVIAGAHAIDAANWHPYVPPNEGEFRYGWLGVIRATALLFFAFLGFETVSTAAAESRNPPRDVPIGILGSLVICTLLYVLVAIVLTGLVPFRELEVPDPIALAANRIGWPFVATFIKVGAVAGLASVLLANAFGHSRVCYAMALDGLLPPLFSQLHPVRNSLWKANLLLAVIAATGAALLPISLMADLMSFGVSFMFASVALCLIKLRSEHPGVVSRFRVPFGGVSIRGLWLGVVPVCAVVVSFGMTVPVAWDLVVQVRRGERLPAVLLAVYVALGCAIYLIYGRQRAGVARAEAGTA